MMNFDKESLSDAPILLAADRASFENAGSFTELPEPRLTSDPFLYRK